VRREIRIELLASLPDLRAGSLRSSELRLVIYHHPLELRTSLDFAVPRQHRGMFIHWKLDQLEAMDVDAPREVGK
jgi:hypothetical protein